MHDIYLSFNKYKLYILQLYGFYLFKKKKYASVYKPFIYKLVQYCIKNKNSKLVTINNNI